jgi:predicted enzyme related to lactoylglutathione lyase
MSSDLADPKKRDASFAFTKLIVHDLEKLAAFYREVYGLHAISRLRGESIAGEEIDEIMLSADPSAAYGSLVLLKYLGRGPSPNGELILGFTSDDLPALLERVRQAGGAVTAPIKDMPELKLRVAFATDPEGHLAELVQLVS